jgi:hypothetical protein
MRILSASNLLRVWEDGQGEPGFRRAILLLAAACPEETPEALSGLSIGDRDARLLTLRERMFGRKLDSITHCPACEERLEFTLDGSDLHVSAPEPKTDRFQFGVEDYTVEFRPINTEDLLETARHPDDEQKRAAILGRCVLDARRDNETLTPEDLPARVFEALAAHLAQTDPQADIQLAFACPACDHHWHALFDIVSFFWSEIHAWADGLLSDIHTLAFAYGWREADILSMSPARRHRYLELATG